MGATARLVILPSPNNIRDIMMTEFDATYFRTSEQQQQTRKWKWKWKWMHKGSDFKKGGTGTFDITLPQSAAAAQILTHFYRKLAYDATRTTADGIVTAIQLNHRHFNVLIPLA